MLFTKEESIKVTSLREVLSRGTNQRPWDRLLIYYYSRLLSRLVSSSFGLMTYVTKERSKAASG